MVEVVMSRIGKKVVPIPAGVAVKVEAESLSARGARGEMRIPLSRLIAAHQDASGITLTPRGRGKRYRMMWGTARQMVAQAVRGVSEGFSRQLIFEGIGYRALVEGDKLRLSLGYSHDVVFPIPEGISIKIGGERNNTITLEGNDKQQVGQTASRIRALRRAEPYKGKGLRYSDEFVYRKEGKKK